MKILVIGSGYVGLVTAACFAQLGLQVTSLDIDENKIRSLQQGQVPIYEPGLKELIERHAQNLSFTTDYAQAVSEADICFLALPTPSREDGSCDLSYLKQATQSLAVHLKSDTLIVNKSTAPVGTTQLIEQWIEESLEKQHRSIPFHVAVNPEFLKEGCAIQDSLQPDRILIGSNSPHAVSLLQELYAPLTKQSIPLLVMDPRSAELAKYASNAMLAMRISFMNEMATLCDTFGADIRQVQRSVGSDPRIGPHFLNAGTGYGGSCFPKDIRALRALAASEQVPTPLLDATEFVNERQKQVLFHKLLSFFSTREGLKGKNIAIWGLAFKPGTDDMRQAPSLTLIPLLLEAGAHVHAYDPIALATAQKALDPHPNLHFKKDALSAAKNADAIVLLTEWQEFQSIDFSLLATLVNQRVLFDGRNQYDPSLMHELQFEYFCIGIPKNYDRSPQLSH